MLQPANKFRARLEIRPKKKSGFEEYQWQIIDVFANDTEHAGVKSRNLAEKRGYDTRSVCVRPLIPIT